MFPGRFPAHPLSRAVLVPLCCHTCCTRWSRAEWTYPASPRPTRWPGPLYSRQTSSSWKAEKRDKHRWGGVLIYFFKVLQEISPSLASSTSTPTTVKFGLSVSMDTYLMVHFRQYSIWHNPSQWMSERVKSSGGSKWNSVEASGTMGKRLFIRSPKSQHASGNQSLLDSKSRFPTAT